MNDRESITPFPDSNPNRSAGGNNSLANQISRLSDANRRLRRKIFDHYTVFEISRHLSSMLDTESLIDAILLTCLGQMGVEGAVIYLVDNKSEYLSAPHAKGIDNEGLNGIKIAYDSDLVKAFLLKGKPLTSLELLSHIDDDTNINELSRFLDIKLAAPLLMKDRLLGILFLPGKISKANYYENDLEFLSLLMNQLSVALENAQLYEREREINEKLQNTQKLLVETEKMAALGKLSASIAHEVNNPLGIISNYLQILAIRKVPDDVYENYIKILKEEVDRIARIVRQLLAFYRHHQQQVAELDINVVIAESVALLSHQLSTANINIFIDIKKNIPKLQGSSEKLKQVFLNLIMNAKDFMPNGGDIEIIARANKTDIIIDISDSGPGIEPKNLAKVFEPFFTTKEKEGTGLGLSVCYGIIQWHQGTITVSNNKRGGAKFTITLPIERKDEEQSKNTTG
ncbi:MAG: GAF domain-containing protein [candidate division Zixibacteria bacterium]|nr:GAF domain-containing protein [candidate division Zixibacteria bacterium]